MIAIEPFDAEYTPDTTKPTHRQRCRVVGVADPEDWPRFVVLTTSEDGWISARLVESVRQTPADD